MDRERWKQTDPLLESAPALADDERARALAGACAAGDARPLSHRRLQLT